LARGAAEHEMDVADDTVENVQGLLHSSCREAPVESLSDILLARDLRRKSGLRGQAALLQAQLGNPLPFPTACRLADRAGYIVHVRLCGALRRVCVPRHDGGMDRLVLGE